MKSIAIIPARSGSKRIPNKNTIELGAKPMIQWTIEAALEARIFDRILVSTDDQKLQEKCKLFGVESPFLRTSYFDDHSPVSLATIEALNQAEQYWCESYDLVFQLLPNCPLRDCEDIRTFYQTVCSSKPGSFLTCFDLGWANPWWSLQLEGDGKAKFLFPDMLNKRSQDLPNLYAVSGAIWAAHKQQLLKAKSFYTESKKFLPISRVHALDIDSYEDLEMAEFYIQKSINKL